jgi:hypothetical protein
MKSNSNFSGRTSRTLNEGFGPYCSPHFDERPAVPRWWPYLLVLTVLAWLVLFWVMK